MSDESHFDSKSNFYSIESGGVIRGVDVLIFTQDRKLHAFDF